MDKDITINDLKSKVRKFVAERKWNEEPAHNVRTISTSIACEAAELMEIFIWKADTEIAQTVHQHIKEIKDEIADIAFSTLDFCNLLNIDLTQAIDEKLLVHAAKYPAKENYVRDYKTDISSTVDQLRQKIYKFIVQRGWDIKVGHDEKALSMSIVAEAAELMEIFNWKTDSELNSLIKNRLQEIKFEIADIGFALLSLCIRIGVDLSSAIEEKIKLNEIKYPIKE